MKKWALILFFPLMTSCGLFGGIDYGPAVQANKGQQLVYEELRSAFITVVMNSKNATPEQKTKALTDIESNRNDFQAFNGSLDQFLITAGEIEPGRILELAKESYDWWKNRKGEGK